MGIAGVGGRRVLAPPRRAAAARVIVLSADERQGPWLCSRLRHVHATREAVLAPSLSAARRLLVEESFDCVVVHVQAHDRAGVEAVAVLSAACTDIPVVVASDNLHAASTLEAIAAGAAGHLPTDRLEGRSARGALQRAISSPVRARRRSALSSAIEAMDSPGCIVDGTGRIIAVNAAWRGAAANAGADESAVGAGVNYLTVCDRAEGDRSAGAAEAAAGIRRVLLGELDRFSMDYPCSAKGCERWFVLRVTPLGERGGGALVVHRDITDIKVTESALRRGSRWIGRLLDEDDPVFALVSDEGRVLYESEATTTLLGRDRMRVGASAFASIDDADQQAAREAFARVVATPTAREHVIVNVVDGQGRLRQLDLEIANRLDDPLIGAVTVAGSDATRSRRHQVARRIESKMLHRLPAAVVVTDEHDVVVYWNAAASRIFGYAADDVLGRPIAQLDIWPEEVVGGDRAGVQGARRRWQAEHDARRADGTTVAVRTTLEEIDDEEIAFHGIAATSVDITDRKELELDFAFQALHDLLTGLPNRRLLVDHLQRTMSRDLRNDRLTAVVIADLDDFATLNDRFGHVHGDAVLRRAADILSRTVRAGDLVARTGGDEFAVCCGDLSDPGEAYIIAERMATALAGATRLVTDLPPLSVSIGIALSSPENVCEKLLRNADAAMCLAKERGKGRVEMFDDERHRQARKDHELAADLKLALGQGDIDVVYQPEYVLSTGDVYGLEALARWTHPERGAVTPQQFIRTAESAGAIMELGAQVLARACGLLRRWRQDHGVTHITMAVNVSPVQLADPRFPATVREVLQTYDVAPECLCLEVTESALAEHEMATRALEELKSLGVETSIDDFGTEYSSLSRLHRFPIDYLKIDRSFVHGMASRPADAAIVDALLGLARSLGLRSVAEGIEDLDQFHALRSAGCELGQGFLWSKPLPEHEATRLLMAKLGASASLGSA